MNRSLDLRKTLPNDMTTELLKLSSKACLLGYAFLRNSIDFACGLFSKVPAVWLGLLIGFVLMLIGCSQRSAGSDPSAHPPASGTTSPGRTLRLKATTEAVRSRAIIAPLLSGEQIGSLTIIKLVPGGSTVKPGDPLVEFDRQGQVKVAVDKKAEYENFASQVIQEQARQDAARAKDETELGQAESALQKAQLEMGRVELLSRIDAEKKQQDLDEAKATREQLKQTFELKRRAAKASVRILEIQRDRARQAMLHAEANAELMLVRSPLSGIVILNSIWKGDKPGEVREGDQVDPGVAFMQIVDPSAMQAHVLVNQVDFLNLEVGQRAQLRLDAYPDLIFQARLEEIAPMARSGNFSNKLRTFDAIFSIEGHDARLMPDLSAAVDVDLISASRHSGGGP